MTRINPTPEPTDAPDLVAQIIGATDNAHVVRLVREVPSDERGPIVMALLQGNQGDRAAVVASAPYGPDPVIIVHDALVARFDRLARLILTSEAVGMTFDPTEMMANSLARVAPYDLVTGEDLAEVLTPTPEATTPERRTRAPRRARDWSAASGEYLTEKGNTVRVSVRAGVVSFTSADGLSWELGGGTDGRDGPTTALRHIDGWNDAGITSGWRSPFESWKRASGARRGEALGVIAPPT